MLAETAGVGAISQHEHSCHTCASRLSRVPRISPARSESKYLDRSLFIAFRRRSFSGSVLGGFLRPRPIPGFMPPPPCARDGAAPNRHAHIDIFGNLKLKQCDGCHMLQEQRGVALQAACPLPPPAFLGLSEKLTPQESSRQLPATLVSCINQPR